MGSALRAGSLGTGLLCGRICNFAKEEIKVTNEEIEELRN
jgi:hypothetical protein